jgi:hypothetical protein
MVVFIASGTPYWKPSECAPSSLRGTANSSDPLTPREKELLRLPLAVVANSSSDIFEHLPFFEAAENLLTHYQDTIASSVQSVSDAISTYKCQGPYNASFGLKSKGEGKPWHPGVLGHKFRADSLSYFLLEIIKEALDEVITASMEGPKPLHELHQQALQTLPSPHHHHLPKPVACDEEVCLHSPKCFTNYEPRMQQDLLSLIVPTREHASTLLPLDWAYDLSWFDKVGVQKATAAGRGYLDKKFILRSNFSGSGPLKESDGESILTFLVEPSVKSAIWICQVQRGFLKYPPTDSELDSGAVLSLTPHVQISSATSATATRQLKPFTRAMEGPLSLTHTASLSSSISS